MTIYVDALEEWGWVIRGRKVKSCHMFTDELDLTNLHNMADAIGMKRSWFQDKQAAPHYDLTKNMQEEAIKLGAIELDRKGSVEVWKSRRQLVKEDNENQS